LVVVRELEIRLRGVLEGAGQAREHGLPEEELRADEEARLGARRNGVWRDFMAEVADRPLQRRGQNAENARPRRGAVGVGVTRERRLDPLKARRVGFLREADGRENMLKA